MNISFHYYAVKTIANAACLSESIAETLASYSQFVDDYDIYSKRQFVDVPIFAQHLAKKNRGEGWTFYPVTTGFNSLIDFARLMLEKYQKLITVPFHFITEKSLNQYYEIQFDGKAKLTSNRVLLRTVPADLQSPTAINYLMNMASEQYKKNPNHQNIMFIGMLLHIFADTFAHQKFSGFRGWENNCKVLRIGIEEEGKIIKSGHSHLSLYPPLGHAQVSTFPDDPYLSIWLSMKSTESGELNVNYTRSNSEKFCSAAKLIYNYITKCFNLQRMNDKDWLDFESKLQQAFWNSTSTTEEFLNETWKKIFPYTQYNYKKNPILRPFALANASDNRTNLSDDAFIEKILYDNDSQYENTLLRVTDENFFHYNVFAKTIRDIVNGTTTEIDTLIDLSQPVDSIDEPKFDKIQDSEHTNL